MDKARDINFFDRQDVQSDHQEHLDAVAKLLGGNGAVQLVVNNLALARHEHVLQYDVRRPAISHMPPEILQLCTLLSILADFYR